MRRIAVFTLFLCAGCAAQPKDCLIQDSLFGDVYSCFFTRATSAPVATPNVNTLTPSKSYLQSTAALSSPQ